ncbi:glycosyltransferase family 24 protein [Macrolepiota fuliginosa MF-IS2]|uniref:Glycosyltransferase family 24 protein n=1 Tax=Macrolepiota fuliginosa MF-IS2 TaxID=1400762 RepID=A0A9P6C0D4_9AGAR|nr:glycosyltransferase family 24 protein [Macrolepiota fuliginosa MF-IS2]
MKHALRLLGSSLAVLASGATSPPVKISLTSSWPAPPVIPEILETITLANPNGFFALLDHLTHPQSSIFAQSAAPEALYQAGIASAVTHGVLRGAGDVAEVQMNLALHAATPKLEAFYQHYEDEHNDSKGTDCGSWVDWYGKVVCDIESLVELVGHETIDASEDANAESTYPRPRILTFDHIYPPPSKTLNRPHRTAVLYATLDSKNFRALHDYLYAQANKAAPHVEYVLRYVSPQGPKSARNYLSGYGVALDLKKMDYLAVDDRLASGKKSGQKVDSKQAADETPEREVDPIVALIQAHPENETAPDTKTSLSETELLTLGHQAIQLIAESSDPLTALTQLSQNFPKYATSLSRRVVVNGSIADELFANAQRVQGGTNLFWLNGMHVDPKDVNVFGLLGLLKKEKSLMASLLSLPELGGGKEALEVLTHPSVASAQKDGGVTDGLFDASDRPEEGGVIVWWNDFEKDQKYARWNPSMYQLLQPTYPGGYPTVKRNIFNIVLVMDLSQTKNLYMVATAVANVMQMGLPFRFGVVPVIDDEASLNMAKVFYHMIAKYGRKKTLSFLSQFVEIQVPPDFQAPVVTLEAIRTTYDAFILREAEENPDTANTADKIDVIFERIEEEGEGAMPLGKIRKYEVRLGTSKKESKTGRGHAFFNGRYLSLDDEFLRALQTEAGQYMQYLQEKVYTSVISDETNMETYFYDLPTTSKRRNRYIVPSTPGGLKIVNVPEVMSSSELESVLGTGSWLYPESDTVTSSLFVVADFDTDTGKGILVQALESLTGNSQTRLTFLHNPSSTPLSADPEKVPTSWMLTQLIASRTLAKVAPEKLIRALRLPSTQVTVQDTETRKQAPMKVADALASLGLGSELGKGSVGAYERYVRASGLAARRFGLKAEQVGVVINGRVIAPLEKDQFLAADFTALEDYEYRKRAVPVAEALKGVKENIGELDRASYANLVSMLASIIASSQQPDPSESGLFDAPLRPRGRSYRSLDSEYTAFEYGNNQTALYHIAVVVDPLSPTAQKWSSLLRWLSTIPDTFIEVHLNPGNYLDMPLKRFYRYNVLPTLSFDEAGNEVPAQVIFEDLPTDPIYTLAMDVPPSWLVRPREALYDLDNILLSQLFPSDTSVDATFSLDYLVVEGHARETATQAPPRGVQLELVKTSDKSPIDDTLVVANLGYLQFKAKPGVFQLQIRGEGRGRKIFKMESVGNEGWDSPSVEEGGDEITLVSFEGLTLYPRLARLPGMEAEDVLEEERVDEPTILDSLKNKVWSIFMGEHKEEKAVVPVKEQADINIFTVASGLLYERFASIMILSVLRNTKSTVKFWFIENFLSPSFLEFIPHMAEKYGFQYELVTYKWPSWLRTQTEKQRIIWAYKILFLDVLFPMDLKKVLFVDADQIVRADLQELVDLDLKGAPYGYTPMGDDNTDMEGFRFWKTGYWKDFLKGRPYHISALYVVDLVKFRQMTAGDTLRGQYHHLSADPHSLANLDQDLPNNLQREVPIFSLHEDWLWCETWCSKDRLHRAKTIDLCQNPLTKEPKLSRARQIPEWEEYDAEIGRFSRELAQEGKVHSRLATAGADVLASAGAASAEDTSTPVEEQPNVEPREVHSPSVDGELNRDEL